MIIRNCQCTCMPCKKCTCTQFKANNLQPYIVEDGLRGSTKGKGALYGGREIGFLFRHLESADKGHLGIECHRRLPNTLCWNSIPTQNTPRGGLAQSSVTGGGPGPPKTQSGSTTRFFSTLFLVLKKNGQMRPVINLKQLNKWVETPISKWREFTLFGICSTKETGW